MSLGSRTSPTWMAGLPPGRTPGLPTIEHHAEM
jgi:hypothetical protein